MTLLTKSGSDSSCNMRSCSNWLSMCPSACISRNREDMAPSISPAPAIESKSTELFRAQLNWRAPCPRCTGRGQSRQSEEAARCVDSSERCAEQGSMICTSVTECPQKRGGQAKQAMGQSLLGARLRLCSRPQRSTSATTGRLTLYRAQNIWG